MRAKRPLAKALAVAAVIGLSTVVNSCSTNPVTGREQFILFPESQVSQMGVQAYSDIKKEMKISKDPRYTRPTIEVATHIIAVSDLDSKNCEVTVFEDDTPNAFALPGCKIGVHTGLFKVAKNNAQLAAVLGHEVGHVVGRHAGERISRGVVANLGVQIVGATQGQAAANLMAQAATLGVILPFGRSQESEADDIGLIYMARAGYDPRQSVELWKNFAKEGGNRPPEFLSTHPDPGNRIARLQSNMPRALGIYNAAPVKRQ